jgi:hypothetical protein
MQYFEEKKPKRSTSREFFFHKNIEQFKIACTVYTIQII